MAKTRFVLIFCILCPLKSTSDNLCTEEFCKSYLATESCLELPEACKIQNSTHSGIFLPSPSPCNCCKYCLRNLGEGEQCAIGDPSSLTPSSICGHSLACKPETSTCQIMDSPCTNAQSAFDKNVQEGNIGHLEVKPTCDRNGLFTQYHCVPGEICYCTAANGERIFGEVPFTPNPYFSLRCKCSRSYNKAAQINNRNLIPSEYFRCQSNGDYDTIQCINNKCLCVDADDGHFTYPNAEFVNITSISASSLPCFNSDIHLEAEYLRVCERAYMEIFNKIREYEKSNTHVMGYILPNCQLDGLYGPVQETFNTKYCSNALGVQLENFVINKTDLLSPTMNCNCARVRNALSNQEKPECCKNGNYKSIQKRRGLCRCVDKNGNQIGKEIDCNEENQLKCPFDSCVA